MSQFVRPMLTHEPRVSLADLAAANIVVRPIEAATIVHELALQVSRGELPGVPSAHVVRFSPSGALTIEGPVAAGGNSVARAAALLDSLLPGFDTVPELRAPGALRLAVARALGMIDLPPYPSIEDFAAAIARFAAPDAGSVIRGLAASFARASASLPDRDVAGSSDSTTAVEPFVRQLAAVQTSDRRQERAMLSPPPITLDSSDLTISDIRRARRATGLTLAEISADARIPVWMLRELEWGLLRNWPTSHYGRTQLVRYAKAAGLDDQLVVRAVWPLLEESARERESSGVSPSELAPAETVEVPLTTDIAVIPYALDDAHRRRRRHLIAALAIPAVLAIGVAPAVWSGRTSLNESAAPPHTETASAPERRAAVPHPTAASAPAPPAPRVATAGKAKAAPSPAVPAGPGSPRPAIGVPDGAAYSPAFASVGSAMFYQAETDGRSALMRADTDGQGAILRITRVVDDQARNFHARPSPDGKSIAFDSDREGERAVFIADADGQNVRRVSGDGFAAIPSWSPDGGTLAFVRAEPDHPKVWNLWTVDLSSGETRRLTSYTVGQPWGGSWFPDGKRIAYSHEESLIIMDVATGRRRVYPSPLKDHLLRTPAVSPDGKRVMFQVYRDGAWMLELADGSMRKVLSDPSAEEYTWSPEGRRVAYHSRQAGQWGVWVMAAR